MKSNLSRIKRDIENLSQFNSSPGRGLTRLSFSEEDRGARDYIKSEFNKAGLQVYDDYSGSVIGRLEGEIKDGPTIMIGSHFDSVRQGGNFDGPAGLVTAMEIARVIKENNIKLNYPVEFVGFVEEEGTRFGSGLFASRAMAGQVTREDLDKFKDENGISIADAMKDFGLDPDQIHRAKRDPKDLKAFLELHIEQGPILENNQIDIGIVDYIVGICHLEVSITGRPDHAGTTPMDMRIDAMDAASKVISNISDYAKELGQGTVATVGILTLEPGSANIVPGRVSFIVDIRSRDDSLIEKLVDRIKADVENIADSSGIGFDFQEKLRVPPIKLSEEIRETFKNYSDDLGFSNQSILSGAGHDAMVMAGLTNVGLIFVPSLKGRSHCPEEWTDYEDLHKGVEVMLKTLLKLGEVVNDDI